VTWRDVRDYWSSSGPGAVGGLRIGVGGFCEGLSGVFTHGCQVFLHKHAFKAVAFNKCMIINVFLDGVDFAYW